MGRECGTGMGWDVKKNTPYTNALLTCLSCDPCLSHPCLCPCPSRGLRPPSDCCRCPRPWHPSAPATKEHCKRNVVYLRAATHACVRARVRARMVKRVCSSCRSTADATGTKKGAAAIVQTYTACLFRTNDRFETNSSRWYQVRARAFLRIL